MEVGDGWEPRRAGWAARLGLFWFFAAIGAFTPFVTLYYRDLGFDGPRVGALAAMPALAVAVSGPLWGATADALGIHRGVLRGALAATAGLALLLAGVRSFWAILVVVGLFAVMQAPIPSLLDGYAVTIGERIGASYGGLRVWGSVGYMAAVLVTGRLMGDRVTRLFLVANAVCLAGALVSVWALPGLGERSARPLFAGMGTLLRNRGFVLLLATAYLIASTAALMYGFLGIHLRDLGGSASLVGVAVALGAASELPVVAGGGRLLARFGASRLIAIAIVAYAGRFLAYGTIPVAVWVLPVQLFHGLSYGAFLVASVTLAHRLAGRELAATAQALLTAVSFGFGSITGSLVGGALLDRVGTAWLFRGAAATLAVTLGLFLIGERTIGRRDPGDGP